MAPPAQMEQELIAERTEAGLDAARRRWRVGGRRRKMTKSKLDSTQKLLHDEVPAKEGAEN